MSLQNSLNLPSGILLIDKPADFSSHDIIAIVRRVLQIPKIGHSGTLDPFATGLLILLIGRKATRLQPTFLTLHKTYQAVLKLGKETNTWDCYGEVLRSVPVPTLSIAQITQAIHSLSGTIEQQIPPFSAKKIKGEKMYDLARKGIAIPPRFNSITVTWNTYTLSAPDEISFTVTGSSGTYVRSLGYMLAKRLGTLGHLSSLRRISIGPYCIAQAFDGRLLKTCSPSLLTQRIQSV